MLFVMAAGQCLFFFAPVLISLATFGTYQYATGGSLTINKVITVMAYINLLRLPMAIMPRCIASFVESMVSYKRLEHFIFSCDEVRKREPFHIKDNATHSISITN